MKTAAVGQKKSETNSNKEGEKQGVEAKQKPSSRIVAEPEVKVIFYDD